MLIDLGKIDGIRILRMSNGEENKIIMPFLEDFNRTLDEIEADSTARAMVITGSSDKYFCTGLDLGWLMTRPKEEWEEFLLELDRLLHRLLLYPKPTVAAINGHAIAGGLFIALCADYRVMREDRGFLCAPEIDLGIDYPPGTIALISSVAGARTTEYLAFSGKKFTGREALGMKLVDRVEKAEQVLPEAITIAKHLAAKNPDHFARVKQNFRKGIARIIAEDDPVFVRAFLANKK